MGQRGRGLGSLTEGSPERKEEIMKWQESAQGAVNKPKGVDLPDSASTMSSSSGLRENDVKFGPAGSKSSDVDFGPRSPSEVHGLGVSSELGVRIR